MVAMTSSFSWLKLHCTKSVRQTEREPGTGAPKPCEIGAFCTRIGRSSQRPPVVAKCTSFFEASLFQALQGGSMASAANVFKMMKDNEVKFVDLRFTDTRGKEQHVSVPAKVFTEDKFEHGH